MILSSRWHNNPQAGFSFVEAIIALTVTGILLAVVIEFIAISLRTQNYFATESTRQIDSRRSMTLLTQQLREVSDGDDGGYALSTANAYQLIFYSDIDKDAVAEQVQYNLTGTTLQRTVINPTGNPLEYLSANGITTTIGTGITNQQTSTPLFLYYDTNNVQLTSPIELKDVTLIKVQLQLPNRTTETYVQLRNFKTNL